MSPCISLQFEPPPHFTPAFVVAPPSYSTWSLFVAKIWLAFRKNPCQGAQGWMGRTGTTLFSNELEICKEQHWNGGMTLACLSLLASPSLENNRRMIPTKSTKLQISHCFNVSKSIYSIYMYLLVVSPIVPVLFEDMPNSGFTCLHCTLRQLLSLASPRNHWNHCQSAVEHPRQHSRPPSSRPEKMVDTRWFFYGCICPCYCDVSCYWLLQCSTWNLKRCNEEAHWPRYQATGF